MGTENVYLFVPNLIGYVRIILALISFYFMPTDHVIATWSYIISSLLDAVDGHAARMLNQGSKFGAFLDMLTDRCATMCLLVVLCQFYPRWMFIFQLSMIIDIVSHWIHCQSALMKGIESHKKIDLAGNPLLRYYYTDRKILFSMCAGNELFYSMLYLTYFTPGPVLPLGPLSFGLFTAICVLCFPITLVKTAISVIQLYAACQNVVAIDIADREKSTDKRRD
jgi:CDP-diacylglycerol--inositol 3-phosphatidyltransferase